MSKFVYIVGYDTDLYPIDLPGDDFLGIWLDKQEMLDYLRDSEHTCYQFLRDCWVAELENGVPAYFKSLHEDPEILKIQEAKRLAEGHPPEPAS